VQVCSANSVYGVAELRQLHPLAASQRRLTLSELLRSSVLVLAALICLACGRRPYDQPARPPEPGSVLVVTNAGSRGAFVRRTPGGAALKGWKNGTALILLGPEVLERGRTWTKVRAPNGEHGWIASDFLAVESAPSLAASKAVRPSGTSCAC